MKKTRSISLIVFGSLLILVAALGALFPFVPFIFSDAQALSQQAAAMPENADISAATSAESGSATASSVLSPSASPAKSPQNDNRLFIGKIGVSVPVVEGKDAGALLYGAWRYPGTSRPHKGLNTVIFGHRFRYLPPNNTTFYNLDKLVVGDVFTVRWLGKIYRYRVAEKKVVTPDDLSVIQPTEEPTVTLITCTPLFTTKERLVIVGREIDA